MRVADAALALLAFVTLGIVPIAIGHSATVLFRLYADAPWRGIDGTGAANRAAGVAPVAAALLMLCGIVLPDGRRRPWLLAGHLILASAWLYAVICVTDVEWFTTLLSLPFLSVLALATARAVWERWWLRSLRRHG